MEFVEFSKNCLQFKSTKNTKTKFRQPSINMIHKKYIRNEKFMHIYFNQLVFNRFLFYFYFI